jgi:hypothetical protein
MVIEIEILKDEMSSLKKELKYIKKNMVEKYEFRRI